MASRHEIISIDFRANAAKANPAMESLREAAKGLRTEIDKTNAAIANGKMTGMAQEELNKLGNTLTVQEKKLRSFESAMSTLSKGVGTLSRAIDAFNSGTLQNMSAAFQKASYNAAEVAKKALVPDSKDYQKSMAELDALQQKNLENLAKYKLRTEQMLQSIGEGGKISSQDLKTEADGLEELMKLLPHLGNEWQEYYQILLRVRDAIKLQADEEKRLKGAIVDANDARERSAQLSRQGAENARQQHEAAKKEADSHATIIDSLKKELEEKRKSLAGSAAIVQQKGKEIESQEKAVAAAKKAINSEKKGIEARQQKIDTLKQENEALKTTAETNRTTAEQMKDDLKGLKDQLKGVDDELSKMGASSMEATAEKKEETQVVEQKVEADKKEEQAVKNKIKSKKDETQAIKENTAVKNEEIKVEEQTAEAEKKEKLTKEQILKRQDELKDQLQVLYKEKADYAKLQEQNTAAAKKEAEAVKEEVNAYKDLTKEQAESILQQKRATITKGEDGKFSFANAEEAQHFIMDSIRQLGGQKGNEYSLSDKGQVKQLLGQFKERYGLQSDDDAVGAMRGLFANGGLVESGVMNPFLPRLDIKASENAVAYAKDIKDLTAVINGNTEAKKENIKVSEESVKLKRTEAEIDADIKAKEEESHKLTMLLRKGNNEVVEGIEEETNKNENLNASRKKSIDLLKQTIEEYKNLSAAKAKTEVDTMRAKSTVGYKGGKLDMSNPEEVQSWLIGQARTISGNKGRGGSISLGGGQVDKLLENFSKRYGWTSDSNTAKKLLKEIIQGDSGLFKSGGFADFSGGNLTVTIKQNTEAVEKRNAKLQTFTAIAGGAAEGIEKITDATKDNTVATEIWSNEVERRYQSYLSAQKEVDILEGEIEKKRKRKRDLPKTGADALLERAKIDREIDEYKAKNLYENKKNSAELLKKSWESSARTLADMMGLPAVEEIKQQTTVENQNTEATNNNTKAKRGRKKATEDATSAQKEQNKVEGESIAQEQKLSAEEQKRQELLKRKEELQGKINDTQAKANQLEEEAAGADQKVENNLKTITNLTNENVNAHTKNEQALGQQTEKLEKLEFQQNKNIEKYKEDQKAVEDLTGEINDHATKRADANKRAAQTERLTIDAMNDAIKALEEENRTIEPQSAKWNENVKVIQQYKAEIDRLKNQPVLQMMTERMGNIKNLSADALQETKKFWEQMAAGAEHGSQKLAVYEGNLKVIAEEERQRQQEIQKPMRENLNNLTRLSAADLSDTKRYWEAVRDGAEAGSNAYKKAELAVKSLNNEEKRRKDNAMAQYINDQMRDLNNLSTSGLAEVKRYWQAMADGAKKGSDEARDAANALRQINDVELQATKQQVRPLFGDLSKMNGEEIRAAIDAGKRLIDTYDSGSPAAQRLAQAILDAEEHLKNYGLEAERAARREAAAVEEAAQRRKEQDQLMRSQLDQGTSLSESALRTQQQYWQRLIDDPKTATESLAGYRYELERTMELQEQQAATTRNDRAARLGGNLFELSEGEIREAIDAGKQLVQTYKVGSTEAEELSKNIVAAEEHLKQHGVEAQRAAVREAKAVEEANKRQLLMEEQLRRGTGLTESALKAQEQYWQRLADDPKAAARELAYYFEQLNKVRQLQKEQADTKITVGGLSVLGRLRGDANYENKISENQRKEDIAALKAYRDSLPKEGNASVLKEIDYYLRQLGATAKEAGKDVMSVNDALMLAAKAGTDAFAATPQEIQMATKAIEKQRDAIIQTIKAKRDSGAATDAEEKELQDLTNKLRGLKYELDNVNMSQAKMQALMEKPANAVNIDELRAAVKRADGQLRHMKDSLGENSKEYQIFAEKVRGAKNILKEMEGQAKATATQWEKAWSRLKTYVGLYMGFNAVWRKLTGTTDDLMQLSDKMGEVRKTTGFTADEVARLSENLHNLDVRTGLTQLMEISASAGQLGLKSIEDVEGFTIAANKLMVALPEMGKEAATEMMRVAIATGEVDKIRKQMEEGTIDGTNATAVAMEKIASTIDRLRANSASTAPEITDFVKRLGAVGAQSGITIDQVSALGSTVSSLGMRVEMSATALSRMIPAIKNNAFQVAKAIKVEPNVLRNLFETGRGMEAILMIFQHIKDAGMDEDNIEKLLGMAGMQDVMKQLNQQGARAGIVFAGLSQNVGELRKQLGIASQAYEENIAIQQEFDRMNETTAAKWERFKNEIEEMFVRDWAQSALGGLIDTLRLLVNIITGNVEPALKSLNIVTWMVIGYFSALQMGIGKLIKNGFVWLIQSIVTLKTTLKSVKVAGLIDSMHFLYLETKQYIALKWALVTAHGAEEKAAIKAKLANNALAKSMNANVILAVVAAVAALVWKVHEWNEKAKEGAREAAKFQAELDKEKRKVDGLFESVGKAAISIDDANKKVENARKALKEAQAQTDGSKESADRLTKAEANLAAAEEELKNKQAVHAKTIQDINTQYSSYLGYMLSEVSSAKELAAARDLINDKLRETITLKQQEAGLERVENEHGKKRDEEYADLYDYVGKFTQLRGQDPTKRARVMNAIVKAANSAKDKKAFESQVKKIFKENEINAPSALIGQAVDYYSQVENVRQKNQQVVDQYKGTQEENRKTSQRDFLTSVNAAFRNYNSKLGTYQKAQGADRAKAAAALLKQMDTLNDMQKGASKHYDLTNPEEEARYKKQMGNLLAWNGYNRNELLKAAGKLYSPRKDINGNLTPYIPDTTNNGWGGNHPEESTDWKAMTAEQLVNRRKQMKEFVNAIQDDTDVTRVLKEDSALQKAIENGMSRDVRTVIEWYNTERLKIQDELHARHLTNTGDWMDPKKQRSRRKMLRDETRALIDELDAYYTERKAKIQEAGNEEGLTEAEVKNRTLANEMEWRQRRMELEKMYGDKAKEVTQEEQDAIFAIIAERTEDDVTVVKGLYQKTMDFVEKIEKMGEQGAKEAREFRAKMDKQAMQDLMKEQTAMHQQMKAVQDIIDKERPFNGITKNLRENLVTMGILTADMTKERDKLMKEGADMADFNARQAAEELKRTTFILGEAENAYSTTIEEVMRRMADAGMTAWADELKQNPKMQEGMMAQLRATYDSIQDAIKKEASLMKKQAETMWNNILLPGGDGKTTIKDVFEKTVSQLGIDQGRVSRANSLISAGQSSERVADKLAIKQMQIQLTMQQHYYNLIRKQGMQRIKDLERAVELAKEEQNIEKAKRLEQDKQHVEMSLRLAMTKEQTELLKQQEEIIARTEDSQNRLYTQLREWGDLLANSMREVMEASNAGNAEYYNELAKLNLTGKGGPGAGTYIVIDNEGTEDARAHYEYLDERQALERQLEIEQENAQAEAWKKVMDDLSEKMNDQITDWMNASLQNASIDENTDATRMNTEALIALSDAMSGKNGIKLDTSFASSLGAETGEGTPSNIERIGYEAEQRVTQTATAEGESSVFLDSNNVGVLWEQQAAAAEASAERQVGAIDKVKTALDSQFHKQSNDSKDANKAMTSSTQSAFAKMTQAANMYGIAYQVMQNDNLSASQKFGMMAVQAAGQAAITSLTVDFASTTAQTAADTPSVLSKLYKQLGWGAIPVFAVFTGLLGGLLGLAASKIAKSKSQIAQATGASASAGRLSTGMLTYAEGNVNEFTDPSSLTPGRSYNVDAADGRTYRARYMGKNAKTHITSGPEFHLVGERGQEAIIDAHTTRNIRMNEPELWKNIQTLYNGGRLSSVSRRGRGMRAFASGNLDDFEEVESTMNTDTAMGFSSDMAASLQASLDRNSDVLERAITQGIKGVFDVYGKGGLIDSYDSGKKNVSRHGERY